MGIKNLMQYIKTNYPCVITTMMLSQLKGKTICIDTPCLMYKYLYKNSSSNPKNWINMLIFFLIKMIQNNIGLCFVLEGKAPSQKDKTRQNRAKLRENTIKRNEKLKGLLEKYKLDNLITEELLSEWISLKQHKLFEVEMFEKIIKTRDLHSRVISKEDYFILTEILECFNILSIQSKTEAETLCSYLNSSSQVDYIYSSDSDVLAYNNVNGFISDINLKTKEFSFVNKNLLLENMGMTQKEFVDFCILCGTDYNTTIPKVGISSAFKLLKNCIIIEKVKMTKEQEEGLNISWIRDKFALKEFKHEINVTFKCPKLNKEKFNSVVEKYDISLYNYIIFLLTEIRSE